MKKRIEFVPNRVCSSKMIIDVEGNTISQIEIIGGCPGNSMGISKLCVGMNIDDVIERLEGVDCRGRGTSCPDQLAKALIELKSKEVINS